MAEKSTFVKVDRNIMSWRWYQDANTFRVFLHLILMANIEDHDFEKITIHRGELATSIPSLSRQLKISVKSVRTALEHLKATGEVACRIYPHYQVISILGYDSYQAISAGRSAGNGQASGRQTAGNGHQSKKVRTKELKNEKNVCVTTPTLADARTYFFEHGRSDADARKFYSYNQARGWKIGKNVITDWHSAADMWMAEQPDVDTSRPSHDEEEREFE